MPAAAHWSMERKVIRPAHSWHPCPQDPGTPILTRAYTHTQETASRGPNLSHRVIYPYACSAHVTYSRERRHHLARQSATKSCPPST